MPKYRLDFDALAKATLMQIGGILTRQAKGNMDKISHGRAYRVGGRIHIASKAGDTANNMSGALRNTIRFKVGGNILEFGAGNAQVNYAKFLEIGTGKMGKRPNYIKSIIQNEAKINLKILKLFADSIRFD